MKKCIVENCTNQSNIVLKIPQNIESRNKWLKIVDRLDILEKSETVLDNSVICSNHFLPKLNAFSLGICTTLQEAVNITTMLKSTALPTRNLPTYEGKDIKCKCHLPLPSYASYCCVQDCNKNSLRTPENIFHQLPISHELNICQCIGLNNLTSPADFLSKNLKVCDQHFKQNAMLIYINSAKVTITSDLTTNKVHEIKSEDTSCNVIKYTSVLNEPSLPQKNILLNALTTQPKTPLTTDKSKINNTILYSNKKNEEYYDMDQICRICLQNGDLKQIDNNSYYEKVTITELVSLCIDISDVREVNFPHKICPDCIKNLKSIYNFKKKCEHSTDILQKYIDKQKNIVKQRLDFEHCYKKPTVPKLDLKQIMENAGISTDGTDFNNIEGFITTPEEIMKSDIPPEIVNKIKDTKSIRKRNKKLSKDILETIKEKRNIKIGGKNFVLAKAFTCKTCKDIFFTEETLKNHICVKKSEYAPAKPFKYKKCMKCKVIIHNQFEQITHTCLKRKRTQLTCRKCGVKFKAYSLLLEHTCAPENIEKYKEKMAKKLADQPRVYKCKICSNKYESIKELVKHKRSDHQQQRMYQLKIPKCRYCKITFKNMDELQQHRSANHGTNRIVTCPTCLKQMTAISYHTHKDIHLVEKRFCCEYCGNRFTNRTNFVAHVKTVHLKLKPFVCDICNRAYNVRSKLMEHKNMHLGIKKYMCDMCGAPFVYKSSLESHFKKNRCGKTKGLNVVHKCSVCEEILPTRAKLKEHRKTHHYSSVKKRSYTCEVCKVPCDGLVDLTTHELTHGVKQYSCSYCKRSYFTSERLEQHLKIHLTITCRCEVCSKGFANKVLLKQHMFVHTGEKNHVCTYCPKRFTQSAHLIAHIRTHTGYKPYRCPHCDKAFALNGNLTAHMRTHTGYQPYSCLFCDQSFIDVRSRKRHMIRKHYHSIVMQEQSTQNNNHDDD